MEAGRTQVARADAAPPALTPLGRRLRSLSWPRPSVGQRLMLINGLMLLALAVISAISWHALDAERGAVTMLSQVSKAARYHQDIAAKNAELRADVSAALAGNAGPAGKRDAVLATFTDDTAEVLRDVSELDRMDLAPELADSFRSVARLEQLYLVSAHDSVRDIMDSPQLAATAFAAFTANADTLSAAMDRQTAVLAHEIVAANEQADRTTHAAKAWLAGTAITTSAALCTLVMLLSASIRRSLRRVGQVAQSIAGGHLTARADVRGDDEVSALAVSLNRMAENINDMLDRLRAEADRDSFATQMVEAFEMADSEAEAFQVVTRVMKTITSDRPMEMLLADSSHAHLERAAIHPRSGAAGCTVDSPFACIAVRRGTTTVFTDSAAVNACPRLRDRLGGTVAVSAACAPVSFMGHSLGVLHMVGPVGAPASDRQVAQLGSLAQQAGARVGTLRAFRKTQIQASTDSLTGLSNRRTLEERVRTLAADGKAYAFVLCDLDHFKKLNDTHGHEAGDKALRLFSEVLRGCLRNDDLPARWGGEEFALLLANANSESAFEVTERIRASLELALTAGAVPRFTASFGVADTTLSTTFEQLARLADDALYQAKAGGRDRAVVARNMAAADALPRRDAEHLVAIDLKMVAEG
jgi:diguanylate cyclase (GGDEF)-like protein